MALLAISGYWESFLFYFNPTHRVEPDQTVSASGQGKMEFSALTPREAPDPT